jgi:uncharacterized protein YkwD
MRSVRGNCLLACLTATALLALPGAAGAAGRTSSESSLLQAINRVRAAHHLHALRYEPTLARAARAHSAEMLRDDTFAHGAFSSRMIRFGVHGPFVGENLAWGTGSYGSAAGIVGAWLASPEHRANLLRPGFRRIGLGELTGSFLGVRGANVVTADFAGY